MNFLSKLTLSLVPCMVLAFSGCGGDDPVDQPDATTVRMDAAANPDATTGNADALPANADAEPGNADALPANADAEPGNPDALPGNPDAMADAGTPDTGTVDSGVAAAPVWADVYRDVISQNCSCHNSGGSSGGLSFPNARADIAAVRAELVTERSGATCGGTRHPRVTIGDATTSLLWLKVEGSTCGSRMPQGGGLLPQADRDLIRDWINGGAN